MCVILVGKINEELHEAAKTQNRDGFSLFTKEQGLIKNPDKEQVKRALGQFGIWHYRIKSSGKVNEDNIHPFKVAGGAYYLYHNGVLGPGTDKFSDTACLAKTLYYVPVRTVMTVLESLKVGQRFCLANSKNPHEFYLYGDWKADKGVLMSHTMYYGSSAGTYKTLTKAQKAGWSTQNYPKNYYGVGVGDWD